MARGRNNNNNNDNNNSNYYSNNRNSNNRNSYNRNSNWRGNDVHPFGGGREDSPHRMGRRDRDAREDSPRRTGRRDAREDSRNHEEVDDDDVDDDRAADLPSREALMERIRGLEALLVEKDKGTNALLAEKDKGTNALLAEKDKVIKAITDTNHVLNDSLHHHRKEMAELQARLDTLGTRKTKTDARIKAE